MKIELPPIPDAERTPLVQTLLAILELQHQRIVQLEETVQHLRDEIARLQGQTTRPVIAPSRLEAPPPKPPSQGHRRPGSDKRSKNAQLVVHREKVLPVLDAPAGSVCHGYEPFVVQELHLQAEVTRYWRQRLQTPDGDTLLAPLPPDVLPGRHFGPGLITFARYQHHHNGVTQPLLREQLLELGLDISAGQIHRLLTEDVEVFHQEKEELLPAGLAVSSYVGVDDTGARHQGHNGYCTVISNDLFASFQSTDTKSRLNFLQVLRGASPGYAINDVALAYCRHQELSQEWLQKLSAGPASFADESAWQGRLAELGLEAERPVRIATEGALLGQVIEQGVSPQLVVLSDGAPQFDILVHASCWVHAERPLARMVPFGETHRLAIERVRLQLWQLYQDLKTCRHRPPIAGVKRALEDRFDALVADKTGHPSVDAVLKEMGQHRADLLRVLERPEVPLHNNGTESDIREYVKKRKISGPTRSAAGRRCRDTFTSLKKTCRKLGLSFWQYLGDRIRGLGKIPRLSELIRQKAAEQTAGKAQAVLV
jgi:hypothetical protein